MRSSSASPARKCRPRAARPGSRPNRSRSWGCSRYCAICRGCCACAAACGADFLRAAPDVFVGIDAPEFNLRLARDLRAAGIPTVQYVSPQVWAWRQSRVRSIHRSVDLVLCLLPFEKRFYENRGRGGRVRRTSAGGRDSGKRRSSASACRTESSSRGRDRRLVAGQPARGGSPVGGGFRRHGALARLEAANSKVRRTHGKPRHPCDFRASAAPRSP